MNIYSATIKNNILLIIVLLLGFTVNAQVTFKKIITKGATEQGCSVIQTSDGGYAFLINVLISETRTDLWLVKTNTGGDTLWSKTFIGAGYDQAGDRTLVESADGGITIIANRNYITSLLHTSATGDSIWEKVICAGNGFAVSGAPGNQYFVAARHATFFTNVALAGSDGELIWQKQFRLTSSAGIGSTRGWAVRVVPSGGFVVAGEISTGYFTSIPFLFRLSANGDSLWHKLYELSGDDVFYAIDTTSDHGFFAGGLVGVNQNAMIMRLNENGDTLWTKTLHAPGFQYFFSVRTTNDGGVAACGGYGNSNDSNWVYLVKFSASGTILWEQKTDMDKINYGTSVEQTTDNGYIVGGTFQQSSANPSHGLLIKTDTTGNILGMEAPADLKNICLYPNPGKNYLMVESDPLVYGACLIMVNMEGRLIINVPIRNSHMKINTESIPAGTYPWQIICKDKVAESGIWIKD